LRLDEVEVHAPTAAAKHDLPNDKITIAPVGDVHLQPLLHADTALKEHLKWIEGEFDNVYYIGMGDYIDMASPSNRESIKATRVYDSTRRQFDELADRRVDEFLEVFRGTKGRWLGMLDGHHAWDYQDGSTSDDRIRQGLEAKSLGYCADIEIKFIREEDGRTRGVTNLWCHHGHGGRKYPLGKLAELAGHFPRNDAFLMGHYHQCEHRYYPRFIRTGKTIVSRPALLGITGGWLKQYSPEVDDYVERKANPPRGIGGFVFTVRPVQNKGIFIPKFMVYSPSS